MQSITITRKAALGIAAAVGGLFVLGVAGGAWASHQFGDVPDSHTHHAGIGYVKDVGITAGCGDGANFCPEDLVKRSQMATFLHRASGNAPGIAPSVNAKALAGHDWTEIDSRFAALEDKLKFVSIVNTNTMRISGANLQVVSGSGATEGTVNGLGNLIVGYNESNGEIRTGSHNLVVGAGHSYRSFGGLVAGYDNELKGQYNSVTGGTSNVADFYYTSVTGGYNNIANAVYASVTGGANNIATADYASVTGGYDNLVRGEFGSVTGGASNYVLGRYASVSGGYDDASIGEYDWRAGSTYFADS